MQDPLYHAASAKIHDEEIYPGEFIAFRHGVFERVIAKIDMFYTKVPYDLCITVFSPEIVSGMLNMYMYIFMYMHEYTRYTYVHTHLYECILCMFSMASPGQVPPCTCPVVPYTSAAPTCGKCRICAQMLH